MSEPRVVWVPGCGPGLNVVVLGIERLPEGRGMVPILGAPDAHPPVATRRLT